MAKKVNEYDLIAARYGFKYDHISDAGNIVCKKISVKSIKALKADGYKYYRMPTGLVVIKIKK